ncbi:MAG: hypothetical protein ACWGQW_25150, partial [bacterium]
MKKRRDSKVNTPATRALKEERKHWNSLIRRIVALQSKINKKGIELPNIELLKIQDRLTEDFIVKNIPLCDSFIDSSGPVRCKGCPIVTVKKGR